MNIQRTALYRHFDADGDLLYVGISVNPFARASQHRNAAEWFGEVSRIEIEWLASKSAARKAEARAVINERPKFNIMMSSGREVANFANEIGIDALAKCAGVGPSAVRKCITENRFPGSWGLIVATLCVERDLSFPTRCFTWKGEANDDPTCIAEKMGMKPPLSPTNSAKADAS